MIYGTDETNMKEIKAIIQPAMLSKVIEALKTMRDLPGVTVSEVKGFGKSQAVEQPEKVLEDTVEYTKKVKIEIVVPDDRVDEVLTAISANAHTGKPGDGKIFVLPVHEVVKIRTGEKGKAPI